ncbi:hypothetical protein QAD02_008407 [Eretmocerus hayati]|uniref:Uncharacterized protein n=1 Tax=Eretmocerus hayati TaxID=131215 RepID=A0ACC2N6C1_9HYME|nr:hypothetical protein QAD02_008407 [Eretmocerus hayati]
MTLEGSSQPKRLDEIRRQIGGASREEIESIPTTDAFIRERIRELNKTLEKLSNNKERLPPLKARQLALIGALEFHRDNLQSAQSRHLRVDSEEEIGPLSPAPSNALLTIQQAPLTVPSEPETAANQADATSEAAAQTDATQTTATATEPTDPTAFTDVLTTAPSTEQS